MGHGTATSRYARLFLDADGANFSGTDYFTIEKFGNSGEVKFLQYSNANMSFWVNTSTQAMTIKNDGKVGIGTTAPADLLHLSSTAPSIILDKTETGWGSLRFYKAGSQVSYIQLDGSEEMVYYQPSGLGHLFYAGGVAALKIKSDGNVGIGTTSPSERLHVYRVGVLEPKFQSSNGRVGFQLTAGDTGDANWILYLSLIHI